MNRRERRNQQFASQRAAAATGQLPVVPESSSPATTPSTGTGLNSTPKTSSDMGTGLIPEVKAASTTPEKPSVVSEAPTSSSATGPRSEEGKAISSRNAVKHNLTATILTGSDLEHYNALLADLLDEWEPDTLTEELLLRQIALQQWRMDRALSLELHALDGPELNEKLLSLVLRYRTTAERAFHKALTELQRFRGNMASDARRQIREEEEEVDEAFERWVMAPLGTPREFVSQNTAQANAVAPDFVSQNYLAALKQANAAALAALHNPSAA